MGGETFINTKVLEVELGHIKELVKKNSETVEKLYNIIAGNGGSPSVFNRLTVIEHDQKSCAKTVEGHEESIKDISAWKNRAIGFGTALGGAAGTLGAGLVKILGG